MNSLACWYASCLQGHSIRIRASKPGTGEASIASHRLLAFPFQGRITNVSGWIFHKSHILRGAAEKEARKKASWKLLVTKEKFWLDFSSFHASYRDLLLKRDSELKNTRTKYSLILWNICFKTEKLKLPLTWLKTIAELKYEQCSHIAYFNHNIFLAGLWLFLCFFWPFFRAQFSRHFMPHIGTLRGEIV